MAKAASLSLSEFRDQLLKDKEGTNAEKLAFALGFFESLITGLCATTKSNHITIQEQISKYMDKKL